MNVTIRFEERPRDAEEVLKRTSQSEQREFDVIKRLDHLMVRCGPYDNSDYIVIERDGSTGEIRVLVPYDDSPEMECVHSVMEEQP